VKRVRVFVRMARTLASDSHDLEKFQAAMNFDEDEAADLLEELQNVVHDAYDVNLDSSELAEAVTAIQDLVQALEKRWGDDGSQSSPRVGPEDDSDNESETFDGGLKTTDSSPRLRRHKTYIHSTLSNLLVEEGTSSKTVVPLLPWVNQRGNPSATRSHGPVAPPSPVKKKKGLETRPGQGLMTRITTEAAVLTRMANPTSEMAAQLPANMLVALSGEMVKVVEADGRPGVRVRLKGPVAGWIDPRFLGESRTKGAKTQNQESAAVLLDDLLEGHEGMDGHVVNVARVLLALEKLENYSGDEAGLKQMRDQLCATMNRLGEQWGEARTLLEDQFAFRDGKFRLKPPDDLGEIAGALTRLLRKHAGEDAGCAAEALHHVMWLGCKQEASRADAAIFGNRMGDVGSEWASLSGVLDKGYAFDGRTFHTELTAEKLADMCADVLGQLAMHRNRIIDRLSRVITQVGEAQQQAEAGVASRVWTGSLEQNLIRSLADQDLVFHELRRHGFMLEQGGFLDIPNLPSLQHALTQLRAWVDGSARRPVSGQAISVRKLARPPPTGSTQPRILAEDLGSTLPSVSPMSKPVPAVAKFIQHESLDAMLKPWLPSHMRTEVARDHFSNGSSGLFGGSYTLRFPSLTPHKPETPRGPPTHRPIVRDQYLRSLPSRSSRSSRGARDGDLRELSKTSMGGEILPAIPMTVR